MKQPKKAKPKNKKLLLQVSLITFVLFFAAMFVISLSSVIGSFGLYFNMKIRSLENDLLSIKSCIELYNTSDQVLDYWSENLDSVLKIWGEEEVNDEDFFAIYFNYVEEDDDEKFDSMSDEDKKKYSQYIYKITDSRMRLQLENNDYDNFCMVDVSEEHSGLEYMTCFLSGIELPDNIITYLNEDEVFRDIVENRKLWSPDNEKPAFNLKYQGAQIWVVGYLPVYSNGKLKAVIVCEDECVDFLSMQEESIFVMICTGIITLVLTNALIVLFIYSKVTRPLSRIKKAMLRYKKEKDSKKASERMTKIKVRNEIGVLADSFTEMTEEIDKYMSENLHLTAEKERAAAELELAAKIQSDMLPKKMPVSDSFELFASMTPAKEVGGDFYDFFLIDDDHLCILIADVSGKGIPAALFMMMSKLLIKDIARSGCSPAETLMKANNAICENNTNLMFVTVWLGILEISTGRLTAANAGHDYPAIKQPDGSFALSVNKHGSALGIRKNLKYTEHEHTLQKSGTIFVYTDGVPEATDSNEQLMGTDRMLEALNSDKDAAPETLIANVRKAIDNFVGNEPQFDDITMLCLKYKG